MITGAQNSVIKDLFIKDTKYERARIFLKEMIKTCDSQCSSSLFYTIFVRFWNEQVFPYKTKEFAFWDTLRNTQNDINNIEKVLYIFLLPKK